MLFKKTSRGPYLDLEVTQDILITFRDPLPLIVTALEGIISYYATYTASTL
jgi:hypothetical protein